MANLYNLSGLNLSHEYRLGRTSVNMVQDPADEYAALVFCGKELRRLRLLEDFNPPEFSMSSIWLTSRENVGRNAVAIASLS